MSFGTVDLKFALSGAVTCVTDLSSLWKCPVLVKIEAQNHWSNLQYIATKRGPCLKPPFFLSLGLHISVLWDCTRDICVVGGRNMRYGPHFLGEIPSFFSFVKIDDQITG